MHLHERVAVSIVRGSVGAVVVACVGCFSSPPIVGDDGEPRVMGPLFPATTQDDGAIFPGPLGTEWFPTGEDMLGCGYSGEAPNRRQYYGYLRFALPEALPADVELDDAVLVLAGHTTFDWRSTDALRVWAQASPDAPEVLGVAQYPGDTVVLSDVSVRWPLEGGLAWHHPGPNHSPDLSPLFEDLAMSEGGLAAGAHVQLWIAADRVDGVGTEVGWVDSSAGTDTAPSLTITRAPGP